MAVINGTNGNDNLTGSGEDDTFYPLWGHDTVDGLGGSDTLVVDYSAFFYDPYAGASVPQAMTSVITSSGGSFGGTVRTTYGPNSVALTSIEHLQLSLNNFNDVFILNGGALALGATISVDGGGGNDRFEADLSALASVSLTSNATGTTASFGTIAGFETYHLTLTAGGDYASTGSGGDVLNGGGGNDLLHGGTGQNVLNGDGGDDQLVVNTAVDSVDGGSGTDTLVLGWSDATRAIATNTLTLGAAGYSGRYYESNPFGFVERSAYFTAIERFVITAGSGGDHITTGNGDDWVAGNAGNDRIDVGSGSDTADGGTGDDALSADLSAVTGAVVYNLMTGSYSGPVGNFINFEGFGIFKTGSGNDEIVTTSVQLDERIETGSGDDKVTVRSGYDTVVGGEGADLLVVDYAAETGSVTTSYWPANPTWGTLETGYNGAIDTGGGRRVYYSGMERFDIVATSAAIVNVQTGRGDDRIVTGSGWDRIAPGGGNDYVDAGGGVQDEIDYSQRVDRETGTVGVIVNLSSQAYTIQAGHLLAGETVASFEAIDNWGGRDTILGIEFAQGGNLDDVLLGNAFQNIFQSWGGNDRIVGGAGWDYLHAGDGVDLIDYSAEGGPGGVIVNLEGSGIFISVPGRPQSLGPGQAIDSFGDQDTLSGVEQVIGTGFADRVFGNASDNLISLGGGDDEAAGFAGNDVLIGGEGNDILSGGSGDDIMTGGVGNDLYNVDTVADIVNENAGEGMDRISTSLATYSLVGLANVEMLSATPGTLARDFRGNAGDNVLIGASGNDVLRLQDGGNDSALGGAGNDIFFFIGSLNSDDVVTGGSGVDTLVLQGPYGALTLSVNVAQIENISILGGNNTAHGDPGTNLYDYVLTTNDANFAAGVQARINGAALLAGEDFTFDGSAETNASFVVYGGKGKDTLLGGLGNDIFFFAEERFSTGDVVNGGAGYNGMFLRGNYTIDFNAAGYTGLFTNIHNLTLTSATDERYARGGGTEFDYNLTLSDAIVNAGQVLTVSGALLLSTETMILDASQESDGTLRLFGGKADDTLKGGALADLIHGNLGADILAGNGGADAFRYQAVEESSASSMDQILDFTAGTDKIELDRIDADTATAGDQAFSWIGSNAFTGSAGQLRAYEQGATWFVEGDTNGDSVADLVIALTLQGAVPLSAGDFIL